MTALIEHDLKNRKSQIFCISVEQAETDIPLAHTRWKEVDNSVARKREEEKTVSWRLAVKK